MSHKTNISFLTPLEYAQNVSFPEDFVHVLDEWAQSRLNIIFVPHRNVMGKEGVKGAPIKN